MPRKAKKPVSSSRLSVGGDTSPSTANCQLPTALVWRISRFAERFELSEKYQRQSGLEYVRQFISAGGGMSNESTQFLAQLRELRHWWPQKHYHYRGVFDELLALAGTLGATHRGYLLDAKLRPAGPASLAARLGLPRADMVAAIKALEKVGLLERVPLPQFAEPSDEEAGADAQPRKKSHVKRTPKEAKKPPSQGRKGRSGNDSETFRNSSESFYDEMTNDENKNLLIGHDNGISQAKAQGQGKPPSAPTTTPPGPTTSPEVTQQGAGHGPSLGMESPKPPARVLAGPNIVRLGQVTPALVGKISVLDADAFAAEIYTLLRVPGMPGSRQYDREHGNYRAAFLDAIDARMAQGELETLLSKAKADARQIGQHRSRYYRNDGSPETMWRFKWNQHFNARASPASRQA